MSDLKSSYPKQSKRKLKTYKELIPFKKKVNISVVDIPTQYIPEKEVEPTIIINEPTISLDIILDTISSQINTNNNKLFEQIDETRKELKDIETYILNKLETRILSDFGPPLKNISLSNHKINNLGNPENDLDAVNKKYVDEFAESVKIDNLIYSENINKLFTYNDENINKIKTISKDLIDIYELEGILSVKDGKVLNYKLTPEDIPDISYSKIKDFKNGIDFFISTKSVTDFNPPADNLNMTGKKINNLGLPFSSADAVNKQYVDNIKDNLSSNIIKNTQTINDISDKFIGSKLKLENLTNGEGFLVSTKQLNCFRPILLSDLPCIDISKINTRNVKEGQTIVFDGEKLIWVYPEKKGLPLSKENQILSTDNLGNLVWTDSLSLEQLKSGNGFLFSFAGKNEYRCLNPSDVPIIPISKISFKDSKSGDCIINIDGKICWQNPTTYLENRVYQLENEVTELKKIIHKLIENS